MERDCAGTLALRPWTDGILKTGRYKIDLSAHLAECDGNYLRLVRLLPGVREGDRREFFVLLGEVSPQVTVEVTEQQRYTTVVLLRQRLPNVEPAAAGDGIPLNEMRIKVRLYHDARCAEVIEFQGQRRFEPVYAYPNPKMRQPDEKAQVNRFLREFLNACLAHGVATEEAALAIPS